MLFISWFARSMSAIYAKLWWYRVTAGSSLYESARTRKGLSFPWGVLCIVHIFHWWIFEKYFLDHWRFIGSSRFEWKKTLETMFVCALGTLKRHDLGKISSNLRVGQIRIRAGNESGVTLSSTFLYLKCCQMWHAFTCIPYTRLIQGSCKFHQNPISNQQPLQDIPSQGKARKPMNPRVNYY